MTDVTQPSSQQGANADADEFKPKSEAEIRQDIINELELDEELDTDKIDKLVKKEADHQTTLSTAIRQKQDRRKEADIAKADKEALETRIKAAGIDPTTGQPFKKDLTQDEIDQRIQSGVKKGLFDDKLESMGFSDGLRKEIKDYCEFKKCSLKEALEVPFIKSIMTEEEKENMNDNASLVGGRLTKTGSKAKVDAPSMSDFDMKSQDGRKKYDEANNKYIDSLKAG